MRVCAWRYLVQHLAAEPSTSIGCLAATKHCSNERQRLQKLLFVVDWALQAASPELCHNRHVRCLEFVHTACPDDTAFVQKDDAAN